MTIDDICYQLSMCVAKTNYLRSKFTIYFLVSNIPQTITFLENNSITVWWLYLLLDTAGFTQFYSMKGKATIAI